MRALFKKWCFCSLTIALSLTVQFLYAQNIEKIVGGNTPDDFMNFSNTVPNPDYSGDATYSITLANVKAGGGLDFPLVLTYNSNRIRERARSGYVGFGWDLNIGEIVRSVNNIPDDQRLNTNPVSVPYDLGDVTTNGGHILEVDGIMYGGDLLNSNVFYPDEWDTYNISTPYDSKTLVPVRKAGDATHYFLEKPYSSWYIYHNPGAYSQYYFFSAIDDLGRVFEFGPPHYVRIDRDGDGVKTSADYYSGTSGSGPYLYYKYPVSWKLTRIDSPNSDHYVDFEYVGYAHVEDSNSPYSRTSTYDDISLGRKSVYNSPSNNGLLGKISYDESYLDYIETLSHKIVFVHVDDDTRVSNNSCGTTCVKGKLLKEIHVFSKSNNQLIKKVVLDYQIVTQTLENARNNFFDVNLLTNVELINLDSDPASATENQQYSFAYHCDGYDSNCSETDPLSNPAAFDYFGFLGQVNLLDKIQLPSGGEIDFDYEPREYSYYYSINNSHTTLYQKYASNNTAPEYLAGVRVDKITQRSKDGVNPDIVSDFEYGDGVRIDYDYQSLTNFNILMSNYANKLMGHIGHRWVEVKDSEGGFTRNYYITGISNYTLHPDRCENTTNCPTTGTNSISEDEAASVLFSTNNYNTGIGIGGSFLYDTYDELYGKVYKTEVGHDNGGTEVINSTSNNKWDMVDSEYKYPIENYSDAKNVQRSHFPYMYEERKDIDGKETITYYSNFWKPSDCLTSNDKRFRQTVNFLGFPNNIVTVDSYQETFEIYRKFSIGFDLFSISCTHNMINIPIAEAKLKDITATPAYSLYNNIVEQLTNPTLPQHEEYPLIDVAYYESKFEHPFHSGSYTAWDVSDGYARPREHWILKDVASAGSCQTPAGCNFNEPYSRKILSYDSYDAIGNVVQVSDGLGTPISYKRAFDGSLLGVFTNATQDQVFSHSFAFDGLTGWTIVDKNNDGDSEFSVSEGKLKVKNFGSQSVSSERDHIGYDLGSEISSSVVWEFDVRIANSNNWDLQMNAGGGSWDFYGASSSLETAIWTAINNEQWRVYNGSSWITLKTGLVVGDTYRFKIVMHTDNNTADYYINGEELQTGVSFRFPSTGIQKIAYGVYGHSGLTSEWYIDNVRLYPEVAQAVTQELDPYSFKPKSIKGVNGDTERFEYDGHNRLKSYYNQNNKLVSSYKYGYSTISNGGIFNAADPNIIESTTYIDPLYSTDFSSSSGWGVGGPGYSGNVTFNVAHAGEESTLKLEANQGGSATASKSTGDKNVSFKTHFYPSSAGFPYVRFENSGNRFGLQFLPTSNSVRVEYQKNSGSLVYPKTMPLSATPDRWYTIEIEKIEDVLIVWIYPKGGSKSSSNSYSLNGFSTSWIPTIKMGSTVNSSYAANFSFAKSSINNISFYDGLGRELQSQTRGGLKSIISDMRYDARGLTIAEGKPHAKDNQFGYLQYAFKGSAGGSFTVSQALNSSSAIQDYWDSQSGISTSNANYAYSYSEYEKSMTRRPLLSTIPGNSYKKGSNAELDYYYGLNTVAVTTPNKTWNANSLNKTISEDPEDKKTISYTNFLGQTVVSGIDMNGNGELAGATDLITKFEYDYNGNLELVEDPEGLETTYTYNALGEVLTKRLPDQTHPHTYKYDKKGRLRFHMDPNLDAGSDHFYYTKYDVFDRPTEVGKYNSSAFFTDDAKINDQSWPTGSNTLYIEYYYDEPSTSYSDAKNLKGRLSWVRYHDLNGSLTGSTYYSYNSLGLVEMIAQDLPVLGLSDFVLNYEYDETGRQTKMIFDAPNSSDYDLYVWFYYDELGRLSKVTSLDSDSESSALTEAEYTYLADGQVKQVILGGGAQTLDYTYTIQGWLDKINDPANMGIGDLFGLDLTHSLAGNITQQKWLQTNNYPTRDYYYQYDTANRLTSSCFGSSGCTSSMSVYDVSYNYDKSGNITTIDRRADVSSQNNFFSMNLFSNSNKLSSVTKNGTSYSFGYDANGNVKSNSLQNISSISYDWRNLPYWMYIDGDEATFIYDANGNRVKKQYDVGGTTYYIRGKDGEVVAAHDGYNIIYVVLPGGIGQINY